VTPKSFKGLADIPALETNVDASMQNSNLYSVSETILLKWMQYHYNTFSTKTGLLHPKKITNFESDLQDSTVFKALIENHYGTTKALKDIKFNCFNEEQLVFNARKVVEAIHEIGLSTHVVHTDISNPGARELLLFVIQLYQSLPHYIPKAKIEFPATLGDLVTKNIELSNPSKNPISYWVKLDGSKDFQIDEECVKIEPGQTINFPIKF